MPLSLQTRRYDGTNNYNNKVEDTKNPSSNPSKRHSTDSSTTESPDSTDYTSDEYLRLPEKINPNASSARAKVTITFFFNQ